ncbi:MAG: tautomerase family protein [Chthonomonadales bacterium]|nr:tautomerase family protein [Chthonomonadales bacterium]
MAQIKVYGIAEHLEPRKRRLSEVIHACMVEVLDLPVDKRFHRFFPMDASNFLFPADRSDQYTIIEVSMFEGRSVERKKRLIRLLFERLDQECSLRPQDVEITILESPRSHWGIRGLSGDELGLTYPIED